MNRFHNHNLKKRFSRQNPGADNSEIDWSITDPTLEYSENLELMKNEHPQFDWGEVEDYSQYAKDYLIDEAEKMGLQVTVRKSRSIKTSETVDPRNLYEQVLRDVKQSHLLFLSTAGHGKSSSLKTIVDYCKKHDDSLTFKAFDNSLAWFHSAPLTYRQEVTVQNIRKGLIQNICNCVYEVGQLTEEQQRAFIATIIQQDYNYRYQLAKQSPEALDREPTIIYIIEESNIAFGSYSLRKNDIFTPTLKAFISVGRNLKLRGIFVATAATGELSTNIRRRANKIYGKVTSEGDLAEIRRHSKEHEKRIRTQKRFYFTYNDTTVKIPDVVKQVPTDYNPTDKLQTEANTKPQTPLNWWIGFTTSFIISLAILLSLL